MLLWSDFIGNKFCSAPSIGMLIRGVHFDFFSPKEAELQVRRLKKNYRQSQLRSDEVAKNEMLGPPPLGHLSVNLW